MNPSPTLHCLPFPTTDRQPLAPAPDATGPLSPTTALVHPLIEQLGARLLANLPTIAPAILAWAVQGCRIYLRDGLNDPACVRDSLTTARQEQDPLASFLLDACTRNPDASAKAADLYHAYLAWSRTHHERPLSATAFFLHLQDLGFPRTRTSAGKYYHGLCLPTPPDPSPLPTMPGLPTAVSPFSASATSPLSAMPTMPGLPPASPTPPLQPPSALPDLPPASSASYSPPPVLDMPTMPTQPTPHRASLTTRSTPATFFDYS